ncbi:MAG: GNAT family N-acetyltransferase, partial [Cyclobacteriaceae bacterium]|nr:GNAT family N-acetyltransferase [Cyclobacteriaceae bacterium]
MQDMLVKLYELPDYSKHFLKIEADGITIRRALAAEKSIVLDWVEKRFGDGWASEVEVSFSYQPLACHIAIKEATVVGFSVYDAAYRNFFGPTGVDESFRGKGIGKVLLLRALEAMKNLGYAYAIIGGVGPASFYEKAVGAKLIEGSDPGIYKGIMS